MRADAGQLHRDGSPDPPGSPRDDGHAVAQGIIAGVSPPYWITEWGVATSRVTLICSRSMSVPTFGEISFFQ